jgi:hypothetical protein
MQGPAPTPTPSGEVSRVLMAEKLPVHCDQGMLGVLFSRFAGFQEIRMAPQRGIAFIEVRPSSPVR